MSEILGKKIKELQKEVFNLEIENMRLRERDKESGMKIKKLDRMIKDFEYEVGRLKGRLKGLRRLRGLKG